MNSRYAGELFYDSEATLRLVDDAIDDLRMPPAQTDAETILSEVNLEVADDSTMLAELPQVLLRAYAEINGVLDTLRRSRTVLEQTTVEKLQQTHSALREASSATGVAPANMLDGLDRALAMVDELDMQPTDAATPRTPELHADLRDELAGLMNCLQFQDITTQQLSYASGVLIDMEHRLADLARLLDPQTLGVGAAASEVFAEP